MVRQPRRNPDCCLVRPGRFEILCRLRRHGIFRDIPVRFRYDSRYDRIESVDVQQVSSPDAPGQYQVTGNGSSVQIKIGDPGQLITGQHIYRIRGS
jgi:hypothetical protein